MGITLSPNMTEEQQNKAAADGIARALLPDLLNKLGVLPGSESKQLSTHIRSMVVSRLLVPSKLLRSALRECRYDVLALKELFRTAATETIALRLLDLDEPSVSLRSWMMELSQFAGEIVSQPARSLSRPNRRVSIR